ncbi:sphingosine kinase [Thraustotheca clavata]|uniref:Sphingosine kinase n=1 Tax=Thraustotheca clavata TaxID=74557 RepID=A0A1V9ZBJ1_9STRA|nr:sphingosine kinase [Thraustotheca clavata]
MTTLSSTAFVFSRHEVIILAEREGLSIQAPSKPSLDVFLMWCDVLGASTGHDSIAATSGMPLTLHVFEKHKNGKRKLRNLVLNSSTANNGINQLEIDKWIHIIQYFADPLRDSTETMPTIDVIMQHPPKQRKFFVLINPFGGTGKGEKIYDKIEHIMFHANIQVEKMLTEHANHATEIAEHLDIHAYDAIVIIGGDGMVNEVIQGFMKRADWSVAMQFPIGVIPGGTGNGLAKSLAVAANEICTPENNMYLIAKGKTQELDIATLRSESAVSYLVLSLTWGFMAEIDIESEKYRFFGSQRFFFGTLAKILSSKEWTGKFSYLEASDESVPKYWDENPSIHPVDLLSPLGSPLPETWKTIEGPISMFWAMNVSHAADTANIAPMAGLNDGYMYVILIQGKATRAEYATVMLGIEKGDHIKCDNVSVIKTRAFQLETPPDNILSADGERWDGGICQVQVHRAMARILTIINKPESEQL